MAAKEAWKVVEPLDHLAQLRRMHLIAPFFEREPMDDVQADAQRSRLQDAYDNSAARYQELMEGRGRLPDERDIRDQVVAYMWFRCLEYSSQCLRVSTVYGLVPIVRALYEHFLRLHWCMMSEANCHRYIEASEYKYMQRGAEMYKAVEGHRKHIKARPRARKNVKRVFRRLAAWTGWKSQPRWMEMANSAGFPRKWSAYFYPLLSERAHGSGWEEFGGAYTEAEEFAVMLGFAIYFLSHATNAAEAWLRDKALPNTSEYEDGVLMEFSPSSRDG